MEFKTGDVVQLNSGGPDMTVAGIIGDEKNPLSKDLNTGLKLAGNVDGDVYCQWFFDNKVESMAFKPAMIAK